MTVFRLAATRVAHLFLCLAGLMAAADTLYAQEFGFGQESKFPSAISSSGTGAPTSWTQENKYTLEGFEYQEHPEDVNALRIRVLWDEVNLDPLGTQCDVKGRLQVLTGKKWKPVSWFEGVAVCLAWQEEHQPDWSDGVNAEDTVSDTTVIAEDGSFAAELHFEGSAIAPDAGARCQICIMLADQIKGADHVTLTWSSANAVHKSHIQMVKVTQSVTAPEQVRLIHEARFWPEDSVGPLIRAVNALQKCSKEEAIAHLKRYEDFADYGRSSTRTLCWVSLLLFEPAVAGELPPYPSTRVIAVGRRTSREADWPFDPLVVVQDVPFLVGVSPMITSGPAVRDPAHLEWAMRSAMIRREPLSPRNPLEAADIFIRSRRLRNIGGDRRSSVMEQALLTAGDERRFGMGDRMKEWNQRLTDVRNRNLEWNAERQLFE